MLVGELPMRSECREPHHSGRPAMIRASVQAAHCRSGQTKRMGSDASGSGCLSVNALSCYAFMHPAGVRPSWWPSRR